LLATEFSFFYPHYWDWPWSGALWLTSAGIVMLSSFFDVRTFLRRGVPFEMDRRIRFWR
jgi:hypothetical protein